MSLYSKWGLDQNKPVFFHERNVQIAIYLDDHSHAAYLYDLDVSTGYSVFVNCNNRQHNLVLF